MSVIINVNNNEKTLSKCLSSLINQSLREIEIICIDDGSDDDSLSILKEFKDKDNKIEIFSLEHYDSNFSSEQGVKLAHGEFISFVNADTVFELDFLDKIYNYNKKDISKNKSKTKTWECKKFN